jgi:ATP-dependent exoDNAse (exonuclease V) alpha subunit
VEISKANINTEFDSLEPQTVPIPLVEKTFEVNVQPLLSTLTSMSTKLNGKRANSSAAKITVTRKALPFVPAFSITTHKAQGQTMSKVVVDLQLPPGRQEIASRYVPLGRVKSRKDIAIIRDFPFSALKLKPTRAQQAEIDRLDKLNEETLERYRVWKQ